MMLTHDVKINETWRDYFNNLLNVENDREQLGEVPTVEGPLQEISREEVKKAVESTKKGNTARCSCLPKDLGKSGVDMMHEILKRV